MAIIAGKNDGNERNEEERESERGKQCANRHGSDRSNGTASRGKEGRGRTRLRGGRENSRQAQGQPVASNFRYCAVDAI